MNNLHLYYRLPVFLQELALSAYGASLRVRRYGGSHERLVRALMINGTGTGEEVQRKQLGLLHATLHHAQHTVPYYRSLGLAKSAPALDVGTALEGWPMLTKSNVQQAGAAMLSDLHRDARLTQIHTGGTTGRAMSVWATADTLRQNYGFFERFKRWSGVEAGARVATFAGRPIVPPDDLRGPFWRRNYAANQLLLSSYHIGTTTLDRYIDALEQFAPSLIDSYPSSIEPIARRIVQRGGTRVRPKAVITSSETLMPEVRAIIETAFGCQVFDHYGSAEMVAFITQCSLGGYHANPDYGVLEILDAQGRPAAPNEEGEIVATGFINPAMPLVRYRMGDLARWAPSPCPCGLPFPTLSAIVGRMDDVILTPDGRRVGRLDPIFKAVATLHEARVVQETIDTVRLEVVALDGFRDIDRDALIHELRVRLGASVRIEFARVDAIPRTAGGKLRTVVSALSRSIDR
jgi:phenylacetate-CoA ligase